MYINSKGKHQMPEINSNDNNNIFYPKKYENNFDKLPIVGSGGPVLKPGFWKDTLKNNETFSGYLKQMFATNSGNVHEFIKNLYIKQETEQLTLSGKANIATPPDNTDESIIDYYLYLLFNFEDRGKNKINMTFNDIIIHSGYSDVLYKIGDEQIRVELINKLYSKFLKDVHFDSQINYNIQQQNPIYFGDQSKSLYSKSLELWKKNLNDIINDIEKFSKRGNGF